MRTIKGTSLRRIASLHLQLQARSFQHVTSEHRHDDLLPNPNFHRRPRQQAHVHHRLVFPGAGIFFYWQAGAVTYLREAGYDLSRVSMSGASAGALTATLAATEVNFYEATDAAIRLSREAGVMSRPMGLMGSGAD